MTTGKSVPEFGPNGAVMNSSTMTAEMQDKIDRSEPSKRLPKSMRRLFFGISALGFCLLLASAWLRDEAPTVAVSLSLSSSVMILVNLVWRWAALKTLER